MRESRFFQNCGTFCFDLYWKYHNFERNEVRATVFLKWTDFSSMLKTTKAILGHAFFFSTKPHNCPHPNSTLYTLSKERVGRLKHFSISCMLPQTRSIARCVAASVKTSTLYSKNNFLPFYILQTLQCGPSMTFWVEYISRG